MSLSTRIFIGLLSGVAAGLFFGELVAEFLKALRAELEAGGGAQADADEDEDDDDEWSF